MPLVLCSVHSKITWTLLPFLAIFLIIELLNLWIIDLTWTYSTQPTIQLNQQLYVPFFYKFIDTGSDAIFADSFNSWSRNL